MVFFVWFSCTYFPTANTNSYRVHQPGGSDGDSDYGIILDGGSTGTKLKIYKWRRDMKQQTSTLKLELVENTKYKPGISDFASRLSEVEGYLSVIISHAKEIVPTWKQPRTPIYFMATAGEHCHCALVS